MKATLTFTLPEETDDFDWARKGSDAFAALSDVRNCVFRPARKHGYSDVAISELVAKIGEDAIDLIGLLEHRFHRVLEEWKLDLQ
jgi:hypothetical protein